MNHEKTNNHQIKPKQKRLEFGIMYFQHAHRGICDGMSKYYHASLVQQALALEVALNNPKRASKYNTRHQENS